LTRRYAEPTGVRGLASHNWSLNFRTCLHLGLAGAEGSQVRAEAGRLAPGVAGAQGAVRTIAVLSPNYLESVYAGAEWRAAWAQDPDGTGRKLLVMRVKACDRPGLLAGVVGVDLFGIPDAAAKSRLQAMVSAAISDRAKPGVAPAFPNAGRAMPSEPSFPGVLPEVWGPPGTLTLPIGS
jgi:hypothetical protein